MAKHSYCDLNIQKIIKLKVQLKKLWDDVEHELVETFGDCYEENLIADLSHIEYKDSVQMIGLLKKEILLKIKYHNVLLHFNHQNYKLNQLSKNFPDLDSYETTELFDVYLEADFATHLTGSRLVRAETVRLHEQLLHDLKDIYQKLTTE